MANTKDNGAKVFPAENNPTLTVPDIPSVGQQQAGFQTPDAPTVKPVDLSTPAPAPQQSSYLDNLSQLLGAAPDPAKEAETERNLQRKARIANLTGAFHLLASSHYAGKGYHVPRATPDYTLAKTQAELEKQKNAYAQSVAAYNSRKATLGTRLLSMQQGADTEKARQAQRADEQANTATYRKGQLGVAKDRIAAENKRISEQNRHNQAMEQSKAKLNVAKNGDLNFDYNSQPVTIPKNRLVGIAVNIQRRRKELGLPLTANLQDVYGDLSIPSNVNKIGWYIAQNYQYYNPPGEKPFQFQNSVKSTTPKKIPGYGQ